MAPFRAPSNSVETGVHPAFDVLVVTAANEEQARGYRAQLGARARLGLLDSCRRWCVISDPDGRRIGSGAATVHALARLARQHSHRFRRGRTTFFENARILIIHGGGDSRRLPAFAAQGKVFVPLPLEDDRGRRLALLDLILEDLAGCRLGQGGRVVVASGDVYLGLRRENMDLSGSGVVGVAFHGSLARGSRHGVYVLDRRGRVRDVIQKPTSAQAHARGAVDKHGKVLIDAGVVALDPEAVHTLLRRTGVDPVRGRVSTRGLLHRVETGELRPLDLYADVLPAISGASSIEFWWPRDRGQRLHLRLLHRCPFRHVGSTRELLRMSARLARGDTRRSRRVIALDSAAARVRGSERGFLYACDGRWSLGGGNVLVNIPRAARNEVRVPRGIGLVGMPIGPTRWAFVAFSIDDDCKSSLIDGGTCCGLPLARLAERGWSPWRGSDPAAQTLWNARLWRIGSARQSIRAALGMTRNGQPHRARTPSRRWSLQELVSKVNHARLIEHQSECARASHLRDAGSRITSFPWLALEHLVAEVRSPGDRAAALQSINTALRRNFEPPVQARLLRAKYRLRTVISGSVRISASNARKIADAPFASVAQAVASAAPFQATRPRATRATPRFVSVECPARIDLAGGWTDTPPMCQELGGVVVNLAVDVEGGPPIRVACRRLDEPILKIRSLDLGVSVRISSAYGLHRPLAPGDWTSLPRAALALTGIAPPRSSMAFGRWLRDFGGLELIMHSTLPKGSGLGTSSILGASVLAALLRMRGEPHGVRELTMLTSTLEQRLSTGGGWQDQVGGITPGAKFLQTRPGLAQVPRIAFIPGAGCLGEAAKRGQLLLYFTGRQRLAKDILRRVVGRYLDRDPAMRGILRRLADGAHAMHRAIEHGTLREAGAALSEYWSLKQQIYPGAADRAMDAMFRRVAPFAQGSSLAGAGGGGFAMLIAKDARAAGQVRRLLTRNPCGHGARFVECAINFRGMDVRAQ